MPQLLCLMEMKRKLIDLYLEGRREGEFTGMKESGADLVDSLLHPIDTLVDSAVGIWEVATDPKGTYDQIVISYNDWEDLLAYAMENDPKAAGEMLGIVEGNVEFNAGLTLLTMGGGAAINSSGKLGLLLQKLARDKQSSSSSSSSTGQGSGNSNQSNSGSGKSEQNSIDKDKVKENISDSKKLIEGIDGDLVMDSKKLDYFFGKVTEGNPHNILRSQQNLKDLNTLGVFSEKELVPYLNQVSKTGREVSSKSNQYGTTVVKSVQINKGGKNLGAIEVAFFYEKGSKIPRITTLIPKINTGK